MWKDIFTKEDVKDYEESWSEAKDHIYMMALNRETNEEMFRNVPHVPFLDLEIVFYCVTENDGPLIHIVEEKDQEMWGISTQELLCAAKNNTFNMENISLGTLDHAIKECKGNSEKEQAEQEESPLYRLTNKIQMYGAAQIANQGLLMAIADQLETDFYILPSSVHEILLLPASEIIDDLGLKELVCSVNETLPKEDVLSDEIYYFSRDVMMVVLIKLFSVTDRAEEEAVS